MPAETPTRRQESYEDTLILDDIIRDRENNSGAGSALMTSPNSLHQIVLLVLTLLALHKILLHRLLSTSSSSHSQLTGR